MEFVGSDLMALQWQVDQAVDGRTLFPDAFSDFQVVFNLVQPERIKVSVIGKEAGTNALSAIALGYIFRN